MTFLFYLQCFITVVGVFGILGDMLIESLDNSMAYHYIIECNWQETITQRAREEA